MIILKLDDNIEKVCYLLTLTKISSVTNKHKSKKIVLVSHIEPKISELCEVNVRYFVYRYRPEL